MPGIDIRLDYLPLVRIIDHEETVDSDYVALLGEISRLVDRGRKFVVLAEGDGIAFPNASQRKIVADWLPTVKGKLEHCSVGTAFVTTSPLQRGAVTALNWIMRPEVPVAAFETEAEALDWCRGTLETANVMISPALDRLFERSRSSRPPS